MTARAIDMRLRPPFPEWTRGSAFRTAMHYPRKVPGFPGARSAWEESTEHLLEEMESAGVRCGIATGRASAGDLDSVDNETILDAMDRVPGRFHLFLGVDLENIGTSVAEVRKLAGREHVRGLSVEPGSSATPRRADDPALDPVYDLCEDLKLPVSISLSGLLSALAGHDLEWCSPIPVQRLAMRRPELDIVVSHAAWPWNDQMVAIALVCPNIYLSPDIYMCTRNIPGARTFVDAANCYLADRMLFGSGYPSRPLGDALLAFHAHSWDPGVKERVLYANAERLLGL